MNNGFGICPQCANRMLIEVLGCWHCGTTVNGRIAIPIVARLPREQSEFVEKFLLANGSLSKVQDIMGCSYPKVRRLLNNTMASIKEEINADLREKETILQALESDQLDGQEAIRLIRGLTGGKSNGHKQ